MRDLIEREKDFWDFPSSSRRVDFFMEAISSSTIETPLIVLVCPNLSFKVVATSMIGFSYPATKFLVDLRFVDPKDLMSSSGTSSGFDRRCYNEARLLTSSFFFESSLPRSPLTSSID